MSVAGNDNRGLLEEPIDEEIYRQLGLSIPVKKGENLPGDVAAKTGG
jgi:hypothetical protein